MNKQLSGIILLNKPIGMSSNFAIQRIRKIFKIKKAGHTGSLDPYASGMLPVCLNEATKFSQYLLTADKTYQAQVCLGYESSTGDQEGELTKIVDEVKISLAQIQQGLTKFLGVTKQIPPMYSALKYQGQPLYKLARKGQQVAREPRTIHIKQLNLIEYTHSTLKLEVCCSKGTYIRTLVEDIGKELGVGAYLLGLHRIGVGDYQATGMYSFADLELDFANKILPIAGALPSLPNYLVSEQQATQLLYGQKVKLLTLESDKSVKILSSKCGFLGVGQINAGILSPIRLVSNDYLANK